MNLENIPNEKVAALAGILRERDYQDAKWGTIEQNPHTVGEWLLIAQSELNEAKLAWVKGKGDKEALLELLQVAAVAVACLEQHGTIERILNQPTGLDEGLAEGETK